MRRMVFCLGLVVLVGAASVAHAQRVLVYDNNSAHHAAQAACTGLGYTCTVADTTTFVPLLTGQTWDLVVMDMPSTRPSLNWQTPLATFIAGGGRAIQTGWDPADFATLAASYQVTLGPVHNAITLYRWNASPVFAVPNTVPSPLNMVVDSWGDNGFYLTATGGAGESGGFTASPTAGQAGIVIGNGGRTYFNGFLFDDYFGADANADGKDDSVELIQNEMVAAIGAAGLTLVPTLGAWGLGALALLIAGLGVFVVARRAGI